MKPVELLGALLGKKSGSSGAGANILKDLIGGALKQSSQAQTGRAPAQSSGGPDLGALVRGALAKFQKRPGAVQAGPKCDDPAHSSLGGSGASELDDAKAVVLIRAMINAAKSDGQLDQREQESIVKQLGQVTQEEIDFLKREFKAPLDVKDYTWSVPQGLEQQVYGLSLMAIDLDQNKEAKYLKDLAHGLRLAPEVCNRIHQHYKAPLIFKS